MHSETKVIETPLFVTPEQYFMLEERVEVKLEYVNGKVIPKEGDTPLPDWVVRQLLKPNFDRQTLNFEFPMATPQRNKLVAQLHGELYLLVRTQGLEVNVYSQGIQVMVSLGGKYRIPDVLLAPTSEEEHFEKQMLTNPIAIFEVLSETTAQTDRTDKLEEYLNLPSLQEYFLVQQDAIRIERYQRLAGERWEYATFQEGLLPIPSVGLQLEIQRIYKK